MKGDINIRNKGMSAIQSEKRKYFVFHVMKSVADHLYTKDRDWMIEHFELKKIAYEYCLKYRKNYPPRISNEGDKDQSEHLSDPYYKNAQVALYIYMMLADWERARDFGSDMDDIIEPLDQWHVKERFYWQDPEVIINFERLKNKDLEKELEQLQKAYDELIDSKTELVENCAREMNRWHRVINGLMQIPDTNLMEKMEKLINSVRIEAFNISVIDSQD